MLNQRAISRVAVCMEGAGEKSLERRRGTEMVEYRDKAPFAGILSMHIKSRSPAMSILSIVLNV